MTDYNYFPDLGNWMFILTLVSTAFGTVFSSLLEWSNMSKGSVKENLALLIKENPLARKLFPKAKIEKSERYSNECNMFSDRVSSIQGALYSVLFLLGITPFLVHTVFSLVQNSYVAYCILSIGYTFVMTVFNIPFSLYSVFHIEEKYGFNTCTRKLFITDTVKSFFLGCLMSSVVLCGLNFVLRSIGTFTPKTTLVLVGVFLGLDLIFEFLGFLMMRMFNEFNPLKDRKLKNSLKRLFKDNQSLVNRVYVMDGSRRSTHSNAFVMGFWKFKRIVLFDTLLKKYTTEEITAILAHELAHAKKGHLLLGRMYTLLSTSLTIALTTLFMQSETLFHAFGFHWVPDSVNPQDYLLLGLLLSFSILSSVKTILCTDSLWAYVSRKMEYAADSGAVRLTGKRKPLSDALLKLTSENLSDLFPSKTYEAFTYDHPSVLNRLRNINETKTK